MRLSQRVLQREQLTRLLQVLLIMSSTLITLGCGGSTASKTPTVSEETTSQPNIAQTESFSGENYTLVPLEGFQNAGLQAYWPSDNEIPDSVQVNLQRLLRQINTLFSGQYFAFTSVDEAAKSHYYKSVFFSTNLLGAEDNSYVPATFAENGSLRVFLESEQQLEDSSFYLALIQLIYQSERFKYQPDDTILERIVSRGLALHFIKENLSEDEFDVPVIISSSALVSALAQLKTAINDGTTIDSWFDDKQLHQQITANAVGYYLAAQHFSYYSGSNASNSFSISQDLFIPWLTAEDDSIKKSHQYVRTSDVPDQIAVSELSRQANLFLGHYFIEGLHHEKLIALSFDDGPSQYTSQILDVLEEAQVPASFFWHGQNLSIYKAVVERSIKAGHTIANHSWNHDNGMSYGAEELWQTQVVKTNDEFQRLFSITPRFYRPPYGEIADEQVDLLAQKGMKVLLWSVDSRDWNPMLNSVAQLEAELINNQHEEVITLMHDAGGNRQNTVDALPAIIKHYKAQGYRFVNLETLLGISDKL